MSEKSDKQSLNEIYKKIFVLAFIIMLLYSSIMTLGLFLVVSDPTLLSGSLNDQNSTNSNEFLVTILFDSTVPNINITWNSVVKQYNTEITLFDVMNSTLNLTGKNFGQLGFFVDGINGLMATNNYFWTYKHYTLSSGWVETPVGITNFIISNNTLVKWTYGE